MVLNYTFTEQAGPAYYSEYTDEEFYSEEDTEYTYEVSSTSIANAWLEAFGDSKKTLEQNCITVVQEVVPKEEMPELLAELEVSSLEEAIEEAKLWLVKNSKAITGSSILEYVLSDIEYYAEKDNNLIELFEEAAYEKFLEN